MFAILQACDRTACIAHTGHNTGGFLFQLFFSFLDLFLLLLENLKELLPFDFIGLLLANGGLFRLGNGLSILSKHSSFSTTERVEDVLITCQLTEITSSSYNADGLLLRATFSLSRIILLGQVCHFLTARHLI